MHLEMTKYTYSGSVMLLDKTTINGNVVNFYRSNTEIILVCLCRAFVEDSGANIKLSSHDQTIPGVSDRMVTITGTLEKQLRAVDSIISKLSEDPNYAQYANAPISYPGMSYILYIMSFYHVSNCVYISSLKRIFIPLDDLIFGIVFQGMGLLGIQGLRGRYAGSPVQSPGYTAVPFASGGSANARSKVLPTSHGSHIDGTNCDHLG